jgi:hypothetical protein
MPDYELLHLRSQISTLRDSAKIALADEIEKPDLKKAEDFKDTGPNYIGVRGWLLLLVIYLMAIIPVGMIEMSVEEFLLWRGSWPIPAAGLFFVLTDIVSSFVLAGAAFYVGFRLWKIKPGAIQATRNYLKALVVYAVFVVVLFALLGRAPERWDLLGMLGIFRAMGNIPFAIVVYVYLNRSKRVATTYGHLN